MMKIYEMYDDPMGRFQTALYSGNVTDRIKVLEESGQFPLAYLTAKTHGLTGESERIKDLLEEEPEVDDEDDGLLFPPVPIVQETNWPLLTISKGFFDGTVPKADSRQQARMEDLPTNMEEIEAIGNWGDDDELGEETELDRQLEDGEEGGWDMEVRLATLASEWLVAFRTWSCLQCHQCSRKPLLQFLLPLLQASQCLPNGARNLPWRPSSVAAEISTEP